MRTCLSLRAGTVMRRQLAAEDGARRLGWKVIELKYAFGGALPKIPPGAEFLITSGLNHRKEPARLHAFRAGVPTLVVELGYLKRANGGNALEGYFQLGWNKIGWVPESAPADRFDLLGLELEDKQRPGNRVLIASQVGNDAQHRLTVDDLNLWLEQRGKEASKLLKLPLFWRPHPKQAEAFPRHWPAHHLQLPSKVPLERALDDVETVVTYNSTMGVDAMLKGVPVLAHPSAHYYWHAVADRQTRLAYLRRLAYAQWTAEEISSGLGLEFALQHLPEK